MAVALKDRPNLTFRDAGRRETWRPGAGNVTDAFKPDQVPGASGPTDRRRSGGGRERYRRRHRQQRRHRHAVWTAAWLRTILERAMGPLSESDALNEQIKQSVALLRRHL